VLALVVFFFLAQEDARNSAAAGASQKKATRSSFDIKQQLPRAKPSHSQRGNFLKSQNYKEREAGGTRLCAAQENKVTTGQKIFFFFLCSRPARGVF
jgi:hypothetical protein